MEIRQAKLADVLSIMRIYEKARVFMENSGNPTTMGGWLSGAAAS